MSQENLLEKSETSTEKPAQKMAVTSAKPESANKETTNNEGNNLFYVKKENIEIKWTDSVINIPTINGKPNSRLKEIANKKLEALNLVPHKNLLMNKQPLGNIPMHEVAKLYNPKVKCEEYTVPRTYLEALKIRRGDKKLEYTEKKIPSDINKYFTDSNYSKNIFLKGADSKEFNDFCTETENFQGNTFEYSYKYYHTIEKPRFFGPKNLTITEDWKVQYLSPLCIVAEIDINCTGFLLVDTFHTVYRFIWESDLLFDEVKKQFGYDTKLTVQVDLLIIKESYMTSTILTQGLEDHTSTLKDRTLPELTRVLSGQATKFYNGLWHNEESAIHQSVKYREKVSLPELQQSGDLLQDLKSSLNPFFLVFLFFVFIVSRLTEINGFLYFVVLMNCFALILIFRKIDVLRDRLERIEKVLN